MHGLGDSTQARLARAIRERLVPGVYIAVHPLRVTHWNAPGEPLPFADAVAAAFASTPRRHRWGAPWSTTWFRLQGEVPDSWRGIPDTAVEIVCDLGFTADRPGFQVEGLAYRPDGTILKGVEPLSPHIPWPAALGATVDVYVEGAANPDVAGDYSFAPTALGSKDTAGAEPLYTLGDMHLALRDMTVWELLQDARLVANLIAELNVDDPRRAKLIAAADRMLNVLDPDDVTGSAAAARAELKAVLASPSAASSHRVLAVGHAHIDTAWLWPLRETVRKCARTFANALDLMDETEDFVFAASSAQQYAWVKQHYPALFERIRQRVAEGRFIPVGGMWVEADMNMPSGESIVRQFLQGKRFFASEFDVDTREVWLPDSFGYSAALPQIFRQAGNTWFLSQKLSWSQVNTMPHHTFSWEGIDGSRIFAHFPPVDSYISDLSPRDLRHAERNFRDAGAADMSLVMFGWGDGGGGPTREMLAAAGRSRDLEGVPRVALGTPAAFFQEAQEQYPHPPTWTGELYLELHRGTYTSQLRTKQGNRRSEALLHEAELWATTATVRAGVPYPRAELDHCWQEVLLLQFHDILPGSSIAWVHREAERRYRNVAETLERIVSDSLYALTGPGSIALIANGRFDVVSGVAPFAIGTPDNTATSTRIDVADDGGVVLDNGRVRVVIAPDGRITSLQDGSGREAIAPSGCGNALLLHRDTPNLWDAWDIDEHHRRTFAPVRGTRVTVSLAPRGAALVDIGYSLSRSRISQTLTLEPDGDAIDIETRVDWRERQKLLRITFDLDVHADVVSSETQFGHVRRPTHENTTWEAARFEVCTHRWTHVAEPGYGVAVANDSSYGSAVRTSEREGGGRSTTLALSLIRSPLFPDPDSDQGPHVMRVSVRPGASIRDAVTDGNRLNIPIRAVLGGEAVPALFDVRSDSVLVETVKLAEDGSGDVIVRCYESAGARSALAITPDFDVVDVHVVDLLERRQEVLPRAASIERMLRPFELLTLRFVR